MLKDQLSSDLMDSIMGIEGKAGDKFFEELVTQLLEKMGYGHGRTTQFINDGGIDGQKLTQLMIQYDLGVSSERIIQIKKIDNDFFDV